MNRKFDDVGRVVIPQEMKRELGLKNGDVVKINLEGDKIILTNPNKFSIEKYIRELLEDVLFENHKDVLNHLLYVIDKNK